jgi:hypothetical protein
MESISDKPTCAIAWFLNFSGFAYEHREYHNLHADFSRNIFSIQLTEDAASGSVAICQASGWA